MENKGQRAKRHTADQTVKQLIQRIIWASLPFPIVHIPVIKVVLVFLFNLVKVQKQ